MTTKLDESKQECQVYNYVMSHDFIKHHVIPLQELTRRLTNVECEKTK